MLGVSCRLPFFAASGDALSAAVLPSPSSLGLDTFNHFHELFFPSLACPNMLSYRCGESSVSQVYEETVLPDLLHEWSLITFICGGALLAKLV